MNSSFENGCNALLMGKESIGKMTVDREIQDCHIALPDCVTAIDHIL